MDLPQEQAFALATVFVMLGFGPTS